MNSSTRLPMIDQIRGFAFILMAIFHFFFDIAFLLGVPIPMFTHPLWILFRMVIIFGFLSMVGVCLSLNYQRGFNRVNYQRRLLKLLIAALVITVTTAIIMPQIFIFFGIIHVILASSILALPFLMLGKQYRLYYGALGVVLLVAGHYVQIFSPDSFFSWVWHTRPLPQTADYAPIIPWFGFVLLGIAAGWNAEQWASKQYLPQFLDVPLQWCGRHALILYIVHQPILWAGFFIYIYLFLR